MYLGLCCCLERKRNKNWAFCTIISQIIRIRWRSHCGGGLKCQLRLAGHSFESSSRFGFRFRDRDSYNRSQREKTNGSESPLGEAEQQTGDAREEMCSNDRSEATTHKTRRRDSDQDLMGPRIVPQRLPEQHLPPWIPVSQRTHEKLFPGLPVVHRHVLRYCGVTLPE